MAQDGAQAHTINGSHIYATGLTNGYPHLGYIFSSGGQAVYIPAGQVGAWNVPTGVRNTDTIQVTAAQVLVSGIRKYRLTIGRAGAPGPNSRILLHELRATRLG